MDQQVVSTYNLFIDSSRNRSSGSKGDDYMVNLQDSGVQARNGEYIRLSLDNFSMAKTFSNVNGNNSSFRVLFVDDNPTTASIESKTLNLDHIHCENITQLSENFAQTIGNHLLKFLPTSHSFTVTDVPSDTGSSTAAEKTQLRLHIIKFTLNFKDGGGSGTDHNFSKVRVIFDPDTSDSYALLGGDRIPEGSRFFDPANVTALNLTPNSIDIDESNPQKLTFTCIYPAQLQTLRHVYIRAPTLGNTNIGTHGFEKATDDARCDTAHSNILGRAMIDFNQNSFIEYAAMTGREFFLNIHQKTLTHLRIKLTDQHNRPLCRRNNASETAAGTGDHQSTFGNLQFSAVLRIDIIKQRQVTELESKPHEPNIPARFSNGITLQQRNGKNLFGVGPGN